MAVYCLKIPGSDFTGFKGGVDFYRGKGSTSSKADADVLVLKCGCRIVEPKPKSEIKVEGVPAGIPLAISPIREAQGALVEKPEVLEPRVYANKKEREANEHTARRRGAKIK